MISFDDVRIEKDLTYLFVTSINLCHVEWCLDKAGVTDYKTMSIKKFKENIPENVKIPDFIPAVPTRDKSMKRPCKYASVIISHMNKDDLLDKVIEIYEHNDPDLKALIDEENKKGTQDYYDNYSEYDGQIPIRG